MRPNRYIQLSPSELITLEEGYKNVTHHQFKSRCHCLILSHQGYDMKTLKDIFNVSRPTITNWFDSWETNGIAGLWNQKGQGRKTILHENDRAIVKERVQASPQQLKQVCQELKVDLQKEFSTKTLKRFLKSLVGRVGTEDASA